MDKEAEQRRKAEERLSKRLAAASAFDTKESKALETRPWMLGSPASSGGSFGGFGGSLPVGDKPAAAKDADEFMTQHAQLLAYINDFQDIRAGKKKEVAASAAGVPDEL